MTDAERQSEWERVRREFQRIVARRGATAVAREVHMSRANVYNVAGGKTERPCTATRYLIERLVDSEHERDTV